jgi:hypothetical protein
MFPISYYKNTMKKLILIFASIFFLGFMAGCSSPEEKAAERLLLSIAESAQGDVDAKLRLVAFKKQYRSLDEAIVLVEAYHRRGDLGRAREFLNRAIALESSESIIATEAGKALSLLAL